MPAGWPDVFAKFMTSNGCRGSLAGARAGRDVRRSKAFAALRKVLADRERRRWPAPAVRLTALLGARDKELPPLLHQLVGDPTLRGAAIRGPGHRTTIRRRRPSSSPPMRSLTSEEKRDALNTLAARAAYAQGAARRRRREEGRRRRTCRPTSSGSCATCTTRTSTSASARSGASSARRRPSA